MGGRNLLFLGIAVAVGLIAVILANGYFSGVEQRQEQIAREQQLTRIVVATQPLEFGQPLTTENIRMQNFPATSVPQGAFRSIDDALRDNRVALRPIVPGEPVLADKVSGSDGRAVLAANLSEGMRAVSIPIGATTGVSGFVRPGDIVDVMLTRRMPGDGAGDQDLMTDVILEKVKVLAIDQNPNEKDVKPKVGRTAVVEVNLYDAQKLVLSDKLGTLSLALRNVENQAPGALTTVTVRDLGSGAFVRPIRARPAAVAQPTVIYQAPPVAAAVSAVAAAAVPRGPTMTVFRGVEPSETTVAPLGLR